MKLKKPLKNYYFENFIKKHRYIFIFHYNNLQTNDFNIIKTNIQKKLNNSINYNLNTSLNLIYKIINKPSIKFIKNSFLRILLQIFQHEGLKNLVKGPCLLIVSKTPAPYYIIPYLAKNNIFYIGGLFNNKIINYYNIHKLFFYKKLKNKLGYIILLQTMNNLFKSNLYFLKIIL